ncbi:MAG: adenosylcobinamide-GDP ribazoletransferase, partial [Chloroflexota bacterium]|nr:adenosylcobinamide-GDP ribazoletransferase [Chloroflexota bacterium]
MANTEGDTPVAGAGTNDVAGHDPAAARPRGSPFLAPVLALQFLTVAPSIIQRAFTPAELGWAVGFFPLVGLLLGGLLAGLDAVLRLVFPASVSTALVLAAWVMLTGALHLDGFLDACDGLLGGSSPEERLRILRDERVGAFAVAGGILLLLTKYAALAAVPGRVAALVIACTLGRWGMTLAVVAFPYARSQGLGRDMKDNAGWPQMALATFVALAVAWSIAGWSGLLAFALAGVITWAVARFTLGRIPGLTGDLYGATCEVVEVGVLLTLVALAG